MRKRFLMMSIVLAAMVILSACGEKNKEAVTTGTKNEIEITSIAKVVKNKKVKKVKKTVKKETTTQEIQENSTSSTEAKQQTTKETKKKSAGKKDIKEKAKDKGIEKRKTAEKYVGKSLDKLIAAIGKYNRMEKAKSCLNEGEFDGMFYYNGFIVSGSTEEGEWIVTSVD